MKAPQEQQWQRVEELADELGNLTPEQAAVRVAELATAGESATVLTLLGAWLELPPPPVSLQTGEVLGDRYILREKLGEGGMGAVWRAEQKLIGRDVALKIIHPALATPALTTRFVGEMKVLGQLDHPGIVKIFDAGLHRESNGSEVPFFVMELIEGHRLDDWADAHRQDPAALLKAAISVCSALASAHERQIVHRDLKPSNIIVRKNGQPVVVDFGIARLRGIIFGEDEGAFSGTPQYAAPEQHLGRDRDFRSGESVDVYALGAVIFEMFAGRRLFQFRSGTPIADMRHAVLTERPPRLAEVAPSCLPNLDEVIARAIRREPSDRFYSVAALGRALERCLKETSPAERPQQAWLPAAGAIVPGTRWKLTEKIGEGGAGEVWLGRHDQLNDRRVFKFCDTEEKARTLKRELTLFRLLKERVGRNPHFVQLHDVSLDEPPWYLMMDFVESRDLDAWSKALPGGLSATLESLRLEIVIQTADALQAAHEAGILHRDVKPSNLLIRDEPGGKVHVLVSDFGIGQLATEELLRGETRLGFTRTVSDLRASPLSGSMLYLAPELLEGNPATARSDIYSLGVVLWQLLTGNLSAALDPADWPNAVSDPILRDILHRCLAGSPAKRWASAGELAAALRALPQRRAEEKRRREELAARERAAYRQGVWRAGVIAGTVVVIVISLAAIAWVQRQAALRARGAMALEQAATLSRSDLALGRHARGLALLESASATTTDKPALRSAAALVLGMADLEIGEPEVAPKQFAISIPTASNETCRALSPNGQLLAAAVDLDGLNGALDILDARTGTRTLRIARKDFPWVPIGEPGLVAFSSDSAWVALGGPETSRHVLVLNATNGILKAYIFQGSELRALAWHPEGRILATGTDDGFTRVWDLEAARVPMLGAPATNDFDLPPKLDAPALDTPMQVLPGQRGPIQAVCFSADGHELAVLDSAGYLGIHRFDSSLPALNSLGSRSSLLVETRLDNAAEIAGLVRTGDQIALKLRSGGEQRIGLRKGDLPSEVFVAPDLDAGSWNGAGSQLCLATLTDALWFQAAPLRLLHRERGLNPQGAGWNPAKEGEWLLPSGEELATHSLRQSGAVWTLVQAGKHKLDVKEQGQGAVTSLAVAGDGRAAAYRGRRIQFYSEGRMAPSTHSVLAGSEGRLAGLYWDAPGKLLGAAFQDENRPLRLESWKTSTNFPPAAEGFPPAELDFNHFAPANDGRTWLLRGPIGLSSFDPSTGQRTTLDPSALARQPAPLAASMDGSLIALVVDRSVIRLLRMPSGEHYADLQSPNRSAITRLLWEASGRKLATFTDDGRLQVWNLAPWREWLAAHRLE